MLISPSRTVLRGASWRGCLLAPRLIHAGSEKRQVPPTEAKSDGLRPASEIPGNSKLSTAMRVIQSIYFDLFSDKTQMHKSFKFIFDVFGPIARFVNPGAPPVVMISRPEDFQKLMQATFKNPNRFPMDALKHIKMRNKFFENKTGIFSENGEEWWRVRSRVQTPMMKLKIVQSYLQQMDEVSLDFMDRIADMQSEFGEMPSDFQAELSKWALESVALVALNRRLACLKPSANERSESMRIIALVKDIIDSLVTTEMGIKYWKVLPSAAYRKLKRCHNEILEIADQNVRETESALKARSPDDERELTLIEYLLVTPGLSRVDVVTVIMDMLVAGIETTASTVAFALYLLSRNPEAQAKLQAEVDTVLGEHQGPLLPRHLARFTYMKAVLKESLRLHPIVLGVGRQLQEDLEMCGYLIPKGDMAMMMYGSSLDEKNFQRANEFLPERWLRHRPLGHIHPYASLPFSTGTRMCVGRRIAEQEIYTFLARVMQRFNVDYKYKDINTAVKLVIAPADPLKFTFTERK